MRITEKYGLWGVRSDEMGQIIQFRMGKRWLKPMPYKPYRTLDFYQLVFSVEGSCTFTSPDVPPREMPAGTAFATFPGLPHHYQCTPGTLWSQFNVGFKGPMFDLWRAHGKFSPERFVFDLHPLDYWVSRFDAVVQMFPMENGADVRGLCALQSLLGDVIWHGGERRPSPENQRWLQQAKAALEAVGRADLLDLESIAVELNTSYANFRKKFTRLAGLSPGRYHAAVLVRRASEMLFEQNLTDGELCERLGYGDQHFFAQRFRKIFGVTPREFRRAVAGR